MLVRLLVMVLMGRGLFYWSETPSSSSSSAAAPSGLDEAAAGATYVVGGLAEIRWTFSPREIFSSDVAAVVVGRCAPPWGIVQYEVMRTRAFPRPVPFDSAVLESPTAYLELEQLCGDIVLGPTTTVQDLLSQQTFSDTVSFMEVSQHFSQQAPQCCPTLVKTVLLTSRIEPGF